MACDLINAWKDQQRCKLPMPGTGDQMFIFDKKKWFQRIKEAKAQDNTAITSVSFPEPGKKGWYGKDSNGNDDPEAEAKMQLLDGLLVGIDIKADSGEVTGTKDEGTQASSQGVNIVVNDNIEDFNEITHALRFTDFGALIPRPGGGYFVVFSPYKSARFSNAFTTGTTYDSDHGHTFTITVAPTEYDVCFYNPANGDDLLSWCKADDDENELKTRNLTIPASATGGKLQVLVNGSEVKSTGNVAVLVGSDIAVIPTPNEGNGVHLKINGKEVAWPYRMKMPDSDVTITVKFDAAD